MRQSRIHFYIRRSHRWLGLIIGIQFLAWTIGGLYFSWSDMDEVHGDYEHRKSSLIDSKRFFCSPMVMIDSLKKYESVDSIIDIRLVSVLNEPYWLISYFPKGHERHFTKYVLGDTQSGAIRPEFNKEECITIAQNSYTGSENLQNVEFLTQTNNHHEYRGQPLPAYAITFGRERQVTFYVPSEIGVVQKVRNTSWRRFDFLWMLHTMDYSGRDNITNWILRFFSILGLVTVLSGFTLFYYSLKKK